jgi:tape measure domain-containing protein
MSDSTEWGVSLTDEVSGPAHAASSALRGMRTDLGGVASAASSASSATDAASSSIASAARSASTGGIRAAQADMRALASAATAAAGAVSSSKEYRRSQVLAKARESVSFGGPLESHGARDAVQGMLAWRAVAAKAATSAFTGYQATQVSRVQRALSSLGDLATGVWKRLGGSGGGAREAAAALEHTGTQAERAGGFLHRAFEFTIGSLMERGIEKIAHLGVQLAASTVHAADFGQSSTVAFSSLAKYGANAAKIFEHVQVLSQDLGMDVDATTHAYQGMLAAQFNPKQADAIIKMGSDLRAVGASSDQVRLAWANMEQIFAKGKADMMDFRQFASYGISEKLIFENMAKRMGVSTEEVAKKVAAGAAKSSIALNAIGDTIMQKTHETAFGEAGKRMADSTMSGLWGQLHAGLQRVNIMLGEAIAPELTGMLKGALADFKAFVSSKEGVQFFRDLATAARDFAHAIVSSLPTLRELVVVSKSLVTNRVAGKDGGPEGETVSPVGALAGAAAGARFGGAKGAAVGAAIGGGLAAYINNSSVGKAFNEFFGLKEFAGVSAEASQRGQELGSSAADGVIVGAASRRADVAAAGADMGAALMSGAQNELQVHSPSKRLVWLGGMAGMSLGLGFARTESYNVRAAAGVAMGMYDAVEAQAGYETAIPALPPPSSATIGASYAVQRSGGSLPPITVQLSQTFEGKVDPAAVESASRRGVDEGIASALERWAEEAG